jgi:hypothetical protein
MYATGGSHYAASIAWELDTVVTALISINRDILNFFIYLDEIGS